jgi:nucleoside-diphosphate-sugar epimerase
MKKFKILVTGGSGFIGTNLIEKLDKDGHDILNIDLVKPKISFQLKFWIKADINSFNSLNQIITNFGPDYIVHLAARTDLDGISLEDYKTNVLGVENILKISNGLKSLRKIVITSSMLVCHGGYYPKDQFDYSPTTIYGESKVLTEKIIWNNKPTCDWAIIRPTSIWGPWFGVPYKNFFDIIISNKYFHIGNRACTKTYGYVGNAIFQIEKVLLAETKDELKKVFFIGDNPATNIEEWGNEIAHEIGVKIRKLPYSIIKTLAFLGDLMRLLGFQFPMNSFRLQNMTTNNIIDLKNTYEIAPILPYTRKEGIKQTLKWIISQKNI